MAKTNNFITKFTLSMILLVAFSATENIFSMGRSKDDSDLYTKPKSKSDKSSSSTSSKRVLETIKLKLTRAKTPKERQDIVNKYIKQAEETGDEDRIKDITDLYARNYENRKRVAGYGLGANGGSTALAAELMGAKSEDELTDMYQDQMKKVLRGELEQYELQAALDQVRNNGKIGVGPASNSQHGIFGGSKNSWGPPGRNWHDKLKNTLERGMYEAVGETFKESMKEILKFAPWAIRSFTGSCENIFHRFFTQIKPLSEDRLIIINNKITKLISPYTQVSLGNFSKEKRAEIDTNLSISNSWIPIKNRILLELDNTINFFQTSLIWFSPQIAGAKSSRIQRLAIKFSNSFSGADHESLKIQIGYTISDLQQLREVVESTKSLKEVQEKHAELKTWLSIVCQDLKYAGQLINYGAENGKSKDGKFMEPAASSGSSSSKSSGLSLSDMDLSSLAGLN